MAEVERRRLLVYGGRVYDAAAEILARHPGGARVIERALGTDMTAAYDRVRHSDRATAWLRQHCVGELVTPQGGDASSSGRSLA